VASEAEQVGMAECLIPVLIQVNYVIVNLFNIYIYNVLTIALNIYIIYRLATTLFFPFYP
jgi:hypothetical protein